MRGIPKFLTNEVDKQMAVRGAEQLFNRKADSDASLTSKAFLNKKVVKPIKNYGKNVIGGAKIVGGAVKSGAKKVINKLASPLVREFKMQDEADRKNRTKGKALNREYSGK